MIPTSFLRWVRRDTESPTRVLQCWHVAHSYDFWDSPGNVKGWWIDVPTVEPVAVTLPAQTSMTAPLGKP